MPKKEVATTEASALFLSRMEQSLKKNPRGKAVPKDVKEMAVARILRQETTIAQEVARGISKSTLMRALREVRKTGQIREARRSTGRPAKNPVAKQMVLNMCTHQGVTNIRELNAAVKEHLHIHISEATIRNWLREAGFRNEAGQRPGPADTVEAYANAPAHAPTEHDGLITHLPIGSASDLPSPPPPPPLTASEEHG